MNGTVPIPTPTDADAAEVSRRLLSLFRCRPETYTASWRCGRELRKLHKESTHLFQGHGPHFEGIGYHQGRRRFDKDRIDGDGGERTSGQNADIRAHIDRPSCAYGIWRVKFQRRRRRLTLVGVGNAPPDQTSKRYRTSFCDLQVANYAVLSVQKMIHSLLRRSPVGMLHVGSEFGGALPVLRPQ